MDGTGGLPLAGVAGFESEAVSGIVAAATWKDVESAEGESLASFMGVSSSEVCKIGSRSVRSLSDETLRVMSLEDAPEDLPVSFAEPVFLLGGAIVWAVYHNKSSSIRLALAFAVEWLLRQQKMADRKSGRASMDRRVIW